MSKRVMDVLWLIVAACVGVTLAIALDSLPDVKEAKAQAQPVVEAVAGTDLKRVWDMRFGIVCYWLPYDTRPLNKENAQPALSCVKN